MNKNNTGSGILFYYLAVSELDVSFLASILLSTPNIKIAATPLQAYLFAQLMQVITKTGKALEAAANHWALMFFILAIGIGVGYFLLGMSSNTISTVSIAFLENRLFHIS